MASWQIYPLSDGALTVSFVHDETEAAALSVMSLQRSLSQEPFPGLEEMVPAYATLTIFYDPKVFRSSIPVFPGLTVSEGVTHWLHDRLTAERGLGEGGWSDRMVEVPVCYEGEFAPDIAFVADYTGMGTEEVIQFHLNVTYRVYMVGFVPGFPYMGVTDSCLEVPRKREPRKRIPPGSVGLAGRQTGIYPLETPGGWQLIGRTPLQLFDGRRNPACLLEAGMQVRFRRIDEREFNRLFQPWA